MAPYGSLQNKGQVCSVATVVPSRHCFLGHSGVHCDHAPHVQVPLTSLEMRARVCSAFGSPAHARVSVSGVGHTSVEEHGGSHSVHSPSTQVSPSMTGWRLRSCLSTVCPGQSWFRTSTSGMGHSIGGASHAMSVHSLHALWIQAPTMSSVPSGQSTMSRDSVQARVRQAPGVRSSLSVTVRVSVRTGGSFSRHASCSGVLGTRPKLV